MKVSEPVLDYYDYQMYAFGNQVDSDESIWQAILELYESYKARPGATRLHL